VKLLPRTLFGRNLLLIAALIVFSELAVALAFVQLVSLPRMIPFIDYARQDADAIALALAALPESRRAAYRAALERSGPAHIVAADDPPPKLEAPRRPAVALFLRELRNRIPATYLAGWQESPQTLWLNPPVDGPRFWIGFPAADFVPRLQRLAVGELACAAVLALLGAWLVRRRIDRPLRELAAAAAAVGAGDRTAPLREDGPLETAQLARAFNTMARGLDSLDRERALMLAGVSHDLRTPLAKIRLALELIGPAAEPGLRRSIEGSVDAANRVIDQFAAFARTGDDEPLVATRLDDLVRAVAAEMDAPLSPLMLELGAPPELPLRPAAIRRVLANLIDNARKYAPGPIVIRTAANDREVVLSVVDGGPGIPPADVERLKRPFARIDAARGAMPGSGLGLAIVDRIVDGHGGRFDLLAAGPGSPSGLEARVSLPRVRLTR
jgi:two-component system osmolarity sensor histidine kinase EnvZ